MDRADLLDGFPAPPPDRLLPDHAQRRADLLAAVRATERGDRRPARHWTRWSRWPPRPPCWPSWSR